MKPHDYWIYYVNIDLRLRYGISLAESQTFLRNVPSCEERGETDVFAGYFGIAEIKNRPVVFPSTFLGRNPLTRQTRRKFNRSRANLNGPIRNTFIVFLLKPIRDNLAPGFPRALNLSPLNAQKSSGSRLNTPCTA